MSNQGRNSDEGLLESVESLLDGTKGTSSHGGLVEIELIATGGMSRIYRAKQPSLGRFVVVKRLREEFKNDPIVTERFRREARALASVLHQNIAHVYDFVEDAQDSFILMEFIEGVDLSHVIEKVGNVPPEIAAATLLGVARGVHFIHTRNLIHRDLKPHNIRLTTRGEVKLMDFGIVMDLETDSLTRPGVMVGSPHYLSPEQVLGDRMTPSADVFLLGICFYEMLTGMKPFKDDNQQTVFQRIRETHYIPPRKMNPSVPVELDRIVRRCLRRRPEDRYASVEELILELEDFLGTRHSSHPEELLLKFLDREAILTPSVTYKERTVRRKWWSALKRGPILVLVFSLTLAGFAAGYWLGRAGVGSSSIVQEKSAYPPPKAAPKGR